MKLKEIKLKMLKKLSDDDTYTYEDVDRLQEYFTVNKGKDNKEYVYYLDNEWEMICDMEGNIIDTEPEKILKCYQ